jgi:hypothetical protein
MMMNQQSQQQQMMQHQQAHMQLYMKNIAYAQHQFNLQQEHMVNSWNAPPPPLVHTTTSQMQRAKTIDKHIKATVLQSDVPQYQQYSRARPKAREIPSPASVFAKSRQKAEEDEDDDKPLAYLQDGSAQKLPTIIKSQSSPNLSARKGLVPNVKCPPPAKRPAQKPHRRSPLAEYNTVAQPDDSAQDNGKFFLLNNVNPLQTLQDILIQCILPTPPLHRLDDLDYIIDMYHDFKVSYDTDQISVVSTGSKPDSQKSVFSWLKGTKKVKSSDHTHFKR